MPQLTIQTNCKIDDIDTLCREASSAVANILSKPESYVMVLVQAEQSMYFAGSNDPTAFLQLKSLGLPENKTAEFSQALCTLVESQLGITPARTYIEFSSPERHLWGWDNRTF